MKHMIFDYLASCNLLWR